MAEVNPPQFVTLDKTFDASDLGLPHRDFTNEGILGAGDLKVAQRGAGANMSVDVAAGAAYVLGDDSPALQPNYRVYNNGTVNLAVAAADPTNPRKDIVIAEVLDSEFAGVSKLWRLRYVVGTPAASPVEPTLPNTALKLATVDVAAAAASVVTANITDRRKWARSQRSGLFPIAEIEAGRDGVATTLASFDFTSIPGDYDHLLIVVTGRGDTGTNQTINLRLNGDTGSNYDVERLNASGATVTGAEAFANASADVLQVPGTAAGANLSGGGMILIPHYAGTVFQKWGSSMGSRKQGVATGDFFHTTRGFAWRSAAAITQVTLFAAAGNFVAGSRATLYGVGGLLA